MYTIMQGESLQIPATVTDKPSISDLVVTIKKSKNGEIPSQSSPVVATMTVTDYTGAGVTNGYLFSLINTSALVPGMYFINYKYSIDGIFNMGVPVKLQVYPGVV